MLPIAAKNGVRIVSNMGAKARRRCAEDKQIARELGLSPLKIPARAGDELDAVLSDPWRSGRPATKLPPVAIASCRRTYISAPHALSARSMQAQISC